MGLASSLVAKFSASDFILTIGALGLVGSGLVEATKAFGGGIANAGFSNLMSQLRALEPMLRDYDVNWRIAVRANWINGVPIADQKAQIMERLSLVATPTARKEVLARFSGRGSDGPDQSSDEPVVMGRGAEEREIARFDLLVKSILDRGFALAEQRNRSMVYLWSIMSTVALSEAICWVAFSGGADPLEVLTIGALVGVSAIPLVPVGAGVTSALRAASDALKARVTPNAPNS